MGNSAEFPAERRSETARDQVEEYLDRMIESGQLSGYAVLLKTPDGFTGHGFRHKGTLQDRYELLGRLRLLEHSLVRATEDSA